MGFSHWAKTGHFFKWWGGDRPIALNALGPPGCPENLDVRKSWTSGKPGRPENLDVRGPGSPETWMSGKPGCPENLDVRGPGRPENLDVRDLDVRNLDVRNLDVRLSLLSYL